MPRLRNISDAKWQDIQKTYEKFIEDYKKLRPQVDLLHDEYFSQQHQSATIEELDRLLKDAHHLIKTINNTPFYLSKDETKFQKLKELESTPASLSTDEAIDGAKFRQDLKSYRNTYLKLCALQREITVPYEPPAPPWYTKLWARIALAGVAAILVLLFLYNAFFAYLDSRYENGIAALDESNYELAIGEFGFTHFFAYEDSASYLVDSYAGAIGENIRSKNFSTAKERVQNLFNTGINDETSLQLFHDVYFAEAQDFASTSLVQAESTAEPNATETSASVSPAYQAWERTAQALISFDSLLNGDIRTKLISRSSSETLSSNLESYLSLNSDEQRLLINSYAQRGQILFEAQEWQAVRDLTTEANLSFDWADAPAIRKLYLDSLQEEVLFSLLGESPDWLLIETNLNELLEFSQETESDYILGRAILASQDLDEVTPILQSDNEESLIWEEARPILSQGRSVLSPEALASYRSRQSSLSLSQDAISIEEYQAEKLAAIQALGNTNRATATQAYVDLVDGTLTGLYLDSFYRPASEAFDNADYATARSLLDELVANGGEDYQATQAIRRDSYFIPAEQAFQAGNYAEAESLLRPLYAFEEDYARPLFTQTLYNLGIQAIQATNYEQAEEILEELRLIDAEFANLTVQLSQVYRQLAVDFMADTNNDNRYELARERLHKLWQINPNYADTATLIRETYYQPISQEIAALDANPNADECRQLHQELLSDYSSESFDETSYAYPILYSDYRDMQLFVNDTLYCVARAEISRAEASSADELACESEAYESARDAIRNLGLSSNYRDLNSLIIRSFYEPALDAFSIAFFEEGRSEREKTAALNCTRELLVELQGDEQLYLIYYENASIVYYTSYYIPAYRAYQNALSVLQTDGYVASLNTWENFRQNQDLNFLLQLPLGEQFAPPLDFNLETSGQNFQGLLGVEQFLTTSELYKDSYYLVGQAAYQAEDWATSQSTFNALSNAPLLADAFYRDSAFLLRSSYYIPGRAAFDNANWANARQNLEPLVLELNSANFQISSDAPTAFTLLRDSYAIPSGEIFPSLLTYDDPNWDVLLGNLQGLRLIDPSYGRNMPYDANTFLHEAYYQRASLAESLARNESSDDQTKLAAWQVVLDSLIAILELDVNPAIAQPNLLFDVPRPYRDTQDRLRGVYHALAEAALAVGEWEDARSASNDLLQLDPADELANQYLRDSYYFEAKAAQESQTWLTAISQYSSLILLDAENGTRNPFEVENPYLDSQERLLSSYHQAAQASLEDENWADTRRIAGSLLNLVPDDSTANTQYRDAYYLEGQNLLESNHWTDARAIFDILIRLDSEDGQLELTGGYRDVANLYRETYYRPARADLEAGNWDNARSTVRPLLLIDSSDSGSVDIIIASYIRPAQTAIAAEDWRIAQQTVDNLFLTSRDILVNGTSYDAAAAMRLQAYVLPARNALNQGDWALARSNALAALSRGISMLSEADALPSLNTSMNEARDILANAYFQPIEAALDAQDWETSRDILEQLQGERLAAGTTLRDWYPSLETMGQYQFRSYSYPIQIAINNGDLALANDLLLELESRFINTEAIVTELRLRLYSQPLANAVETEDWTSATAFYLRLREELALPTDLDAVLFDFPQINQILLGANLDFWQRGNLSNGFEGRVSRSDLMAVTVNSTGTRLFVGDSLGYIYAYNIDGVFSELYAIQTGSSLVTDLIIDPRGRWLASVHSDESLQIWDSENGHLIAEISNSGGIFTRLALSADANRLALANQNGELSLYDTNNWAELQTISHGEAITAIAFHDNNAILIAGALGKVSYWSLEDASLIFEINSEIYVQDLLVLTESNQFIVLGLSSEMQIWQLDGQFVSRLNAYPDWMRRAELTADGQAFLSVTADGTLLVWDISLANPINQARIGFENAYDMDMSLNGDVLVIIGEDGRVSVIRARQWQ